MPLFVFETLLNCCSLSEEDEDDESESLLSLDSESEPSKLYQNLSIIFYLNIIQTKAIRQFCSHQTYK